MNVRESIRIKVPVDRLFAYLMNVENRKDYVPSLDVVIMLDPLPIRKGSRYIEVAKIAGRNLKTTYQVTRFEENKRITAKTLKSIFPIQADLKLLEVGSESVLTIDLEFKLSGIFRMGSGIVGGIVSRQALDILERVKNNLER